MKTPDFNHLAVSPYLVAHHEAAKRDIREDEAERFALLSDEWMKHLYEVSEHARKRLTGPGRSDIQWAAMMINHWLDAWTKNPGIILKRIEAVRAAREKFRPKAEDSLFAKKTEEATP